MNATEIKPEIRDRAAEGVTHASHCTGDHGFGYSIREVPEADHVHVRAECQFCKAWNEVSASRLELALGEDSASGKIAFEAAHAKLEQEQAERTAAKDQEARDQAEARRKRVLRAQQAHNLVQAMANRLHRLGFPGSLEFRSSEEHSLRVKVVSVPRKAAKSLEGSDYVNAHDAAVALGLVPKADRSGPDPFAGVTKESGTGRLLRSEVLEMMREAKVPESRLAETNE